MAAGFWLLAGVPPPAPDAADAEARHRDRRERMVERQIQARGVADPRVLAVMGRVPRHRFVPPALAEQAYRDSPLPIENGQTISQPYIVALMTELLQPEPTDRILEVGTGSAYQAAVLAALVKAVYTIEIVAPLCESARTRLAALGYANVSVRCGDGYQGWPARAPFDGVIVTAAPDHVPQPLLDQLAVGGRLVIPVGSRHQELLVIERTERGFDRRSVLPVRFVPMTGQARQEGGTPEP